MKFTRIAARRTLTAVLVLFAVLASLVVTASPAAAEVTAPGSTLSKSALYRGQSFTITYGDILCNGAPDYSYSSIAVSVAGANQTSIISGISSQSNLHVPSNAPLGTNAVTGRVNSGPCSGQTFEFATFEVIGMQVDVTVTTDATLYRPTDTATITANLTATGNPGQSLDAYTARFLRDGQLIGTAPITGGTAVLHSAPVGAAGLHNLEVRIADWELGTLTATPYEVVAIPVTLTVTGPAAVPAGMPAAFTITATTPERTANLGALSATIDGNSVPVNAVGATAAVVATELAAGSHALAVTLPAGGDFEAAATSFDFEVERHVAALHALIPGPVTYGAPFEIAVQVTSVSGEGLDGTVSATVGPETLTATVPADGTVTIAVPAEVAAQLYAGPHIFTVNYDGGSTHRTETTAATTVIGVAPTVIEIALDSVTAGAPVTATITVTAEHGTPDGYVTFEFDGHTRGDPIILLTAGTAKVTIPARTAGPHTMTAMYWGTSGLRYDGGTISTLATFTHAETTTGVVFHGVAPAVSRTTTWDARACVEITDPDVTVVPADGTELEVSVFRDGSPFHEFTVAASDRGTCFGTGAFSSNYPAGTYTMDVTFPGNAYLAPSTGTTTFTIEHATTAMTLAVDPDTALPQAGTTFTATLSDPVDGGAHGGTVTLHVNGDPVGTATVDPATNTATVTVPLDVGTATVTATYSGDEYHDPVTANITVGVAQLVSEVTVTVTPPTVALGEISTFTAEVTAAPAPTGVTGPGGPTGPIGPGGLLSVDQAAAPTPTGTVTFLVDGRPVGTAALIDGVATFNHTFTAVGSYAVTATYSGDANTAPATAIDASDAAGATVIAAPEPQPEPPTVIPAPDTLTPAPVAGDADGSTPGTPRGGNMAHTGSDASTLLSLAAVLLIAGFAVTIANSRRRRRTH